ncbi:MAG: trypsin-like peptidase domain-containing protein [Fuerstiella sp.]|nr:trypsin-like peptidase domain-containing protein [Fuerstiella sp.]
MIIDNARIIHCLPVLLSVVIAVSSVSADEAPVNVSVSPESDIEQLASSVQKSLVVIEGTGRSGDRRGEGSGFAIADDLIATARHVIGEGRRVSIVLPDGRHVPVLQVYSQTAHLDMVILKTESHGLPPLTLSDQEAPVGRPVVALGHPHGLRNSVVNGVVSGRRDIDGISMIQLAMAIEPGNSGGPVVDYEGMVVGMVTLKSTATDNIGFAIPISHLHGLRESPNPIEMDRWVTIGALDSQRWKPIGGTGWKQRAGRIKVEGWGTGFGGRTLCMLKQVHEIPIEIEVDVKLGNERGAAGLMMHSDGGDRHYGFYPSAGNIRFTRFDGPSVNHWTILHNEPHSSYRPNDWNTLKVRIQADTISCQLNGNPVFETQDKVIPHGSLGFAAFRGTEATFRNLSIAPSIPSRLPSVEQQQKVTDLLNQMQPDQPLSRQLISELTPLGQGVGGLLARKAAEIDARAVLVRQLADDVHTAQIAQQLSSILTGKSSDESQPDLLTAALLLAELDNDEIRGRDYVTRVDSMANEIRSGFSDDADEQQRLQALDQWLFEENGFRGSRQQYYARSNSYMNEVIDDREGLPIALSVLYMELGQRLNLNMSGIGLPGHYIVKFEPADSEHEPEWIDVFNRGKRLTDDDLNDHLQDRGLTMEPEYLEPQSATRIIERMLRNLLGLAEHDRSDQRVLRYLELLVTISGDNPEFRAKRLEIRVRTGHPTMALEDVDWFYTTQPDGIDLQQLQQLKTRLEADIPGQN